MIDLNPHHLETVKRILAEHLPDCEVRAFGSRATWTAWEYSDLDLAVVSPEPLDWKTRSSLREAFQESDLPIRVDVVDWASLSDGFRRTIDGNCVVLQEAATSSDWHQTTIGDIAQVVGGGTPSTKVPANFDGDIPWLTPKDLSGPHDRYVARGARNLSQQGLDSSSAKLLPADSVLLSTRAPIGYVALAKNPISTNQGFRSLIANENCDPQYLYYWLTANTEELERHASGTTFRELSGTSLKNIRLQLPPLHEQRRIARILGALDDKIELNRRISRTLEAIAQTLFKSWFVDFDPVQAKANGQPTNLPPEIDALFPNNFQDSELGPIPEGWEVGSLGDVAVERRRSVKPGEIDPSTPYISLAHMPQRSIALSQWDAADGIESGKWAFEQGEILFGKLRPYFHKVGIAPVDGICSTDIVVTAPTSPDWFGFVLGHMSSAEFVDYTDAGSTGTRMPRTSWKRMAQYEVALPPDEVSGAFTACVRPSTDRIVCATQKSHILSALRDTLLPQLISGEAAFASVGEVEN